MFAALTAFSAFMTVALTIFMIVVVVVVIFIIVIVIVMNSSTRGFHSTQSWILNFIICCGNDGTSGVGCCRLAI
jgi:hypothetical protein